MSFTANKKFRKAPHLKAFILESILSSCISGSTSLDLLVNLERTMISAGRYIRLSSLKHTLNKYLFYLIEYELVSYEGFSKVFMIEEGGYSLLFFIVNKMNVMEGNNDIDTSTIITINRFLDRIH